MLEFDFNNNVIKAAPIAGAAGTEMASKIMGLTLNEWFYVATIIYILVQIGLMIYDKVATNRREDKKIEYTYSQTTRRRTEETTTNNK